MSKYKQATKFERSGCQKDRSHTPHWVIITKNGFVDCPFGLMWVSKKEAKECAEYEFEGWSGAEGYTGRDERILMKREWKKEVEI